MKSVVLQPDIHFADHSHIMYGEGERRLVGHMPVELSRVASHFLKRGGTISATVLDDSLLRSTRADGLVIRVKFKFTHPVRNTLEKAYKLVVDCLRTIPTSS